jgi:hypothetical protein
MPIGFARQCCGDDIALLDPATYSFGTRRRVLQVLHLAGARPLNPPHPVSEWLSNVVNGWIVGAGHFNQLEVPDQVNAMIEGFLRHYV